MRLRFLFLAPLCIGFGAGCAITPAASGPKFVEPPPTAPHAMVVVATSHDKVFGTEADERLAIDDGVIPLVQQGTALRVSPGAPRWSFGTSFSHTEMRTRLGWVTHLTTETDWCKSYDSHGNCVSGTKLVSKMELEPVQSAERILDARCDASGRYALEAARSYRITYHFQDNHTCEVTCMELGADKDGTPCTVAADIARPVATTKTAAAAPTSTEPETTRPLDGYGHAALGLGLLGVTAGAVAWHYVSESKATIGDHCDTNRTCDAQGLGAAHDAKLAASVRDVSLGVGSVLVVTGLGIMLFGPSKTAPQPTVAIDHQGARIGIGGSF